MNKEITKVNIWDLDGTVINSFHRVQPCLDIEGNLNLQKYITEACTHELVMGDTLLPLVETMKQSIRKGEVNVIVTARTMGKSDYYFLRKQGIRNRGFNAIQSFSRDSLARHFPLEQVRALYNSRDADYKRAYFELLQAKYPNAEFTVYDDHQGVLATAASMGFKVLDATMINDIISVGCSIIGDNIIDEHMNDDLDVEYLLTKLEFAWSSLTAEEQDEYRTNSNVRKLLAA